MSHEATDHTQGVPSTAAVAGHPLHPLLIPFPIAFLLGAFLADVAFWWTADPFWARGAFWLTAAGALGAVVAAVAGLTDFLTIERARMHRIGWIHAVGAGAVVAIAALSTLIRAGDPVAAALPVGIALSALAAAALLVVGWAGGELAYRHMIGVTGHADEGGGHAEARGKGHEESGHAERGPSRKSGKAAMAGGSMSGMDHGAMGGGAIGGGAYAVTRPQLAAVTMLTIIALVAGVLIAVGSANLTLSARLVGGRVMPPGMIMTRETSAEAMRDMAAVDLREVSYTAAPDERGDRPLEPRVEGGVKVFEIVTSVIRWNILPGTRVGAYAYNRQIPGPRLRVTEGDRLRINVRNRLPESTTIHWHGLILPNAMDGPAEITQRPIQPGETFTYEFTARQAGTFFYHSHDHADRQVALGLYGALIIDPRQAPAPPAYDKELIVQLQEWLHRNGYTFPAMPMDGGQPNFFTINGKAYPATETVRLRVGERLLVRFIGTNSAFIHPMHIHGGPFRIVATDGTPVPAADQQVKDTVNVGPGERYDVIWQPTEPGKWLLHCHINHHTTNDNREEEGGGGLTLVLEVSP